MVLELKLPGCRGRPGGFLRGRREPWRRTVGAYFALGEGQGFAVFNPEDVVRSGPVLGVGLVSLN